MVYKFPLQIQTIEGACNSKLHLWHPLKYIVWPWGSQGEDGVNQIVSMGVDQEISDFLIGDLEIWPALDLIDMSIVVRIDVGSRLFMLL